MTEDCQRFWARLLASISSQSLSISYSEGKTFWPKYTNIFTLYFFFLESLYKPFDTSNCIPISLTSLTFLTFLMTSRKNNLDIGRKKFCLIKKSYGKIMKRKKLLQDVVKKESYVYVIFAYLSNYSASLRWNGLKVKLNWIYKNRNTNRISTFFQIFISY